MAWEDKVLDEYATGEEVYSQEPRTRGDFVFTERGLNQIEKELSWATHLGLVISLQTQENVWNAIELLLKLAKEVSFSTSINDKTRVKLNEEYNKLYNGYYGINFCSVEGRGSFPKVDDNDFVPLYALYPFKQKTARTEAIHRIEIAGFCDLKGTLMESIPFQTWKYYRRKAENVIATPEAELKAMIRGIIDYRIEERINELKHNVYLNKKVLKLPAEQVIKVDRIKLSDLKMVNEETLKQGDIIIPYLANKTNVMRNRTKFQDIDNPKVFKFGANFFVNFSSLLSFTMNAPSNIRFDRLNDTLGFLSEGIISFWGDTQNKGKKENRKNILRISLHEVIAQEADPKKALEEIKLDISDSFSSVLATWKNLRSASNVKTRWTDLEFWDLRKWEYECFNILSYTYGKIFAISNKILMRDPYLKGVDMGGKSPWDRYKESIPTGFSYEESKEEEEEEQKK